MGPGSSWLLHVSKKDSIAPAPNLHKKLLTGRTSIASQRISCRLNCGVTEDRAGGAASDLYMYLVGGGVVDSNRPAWMVDSPRKGPNSRCDGAGGTKIKVPPICTATDARGHAKPRNHSLRQYQGQSLAVGTINVDSWHDAVGLSSLLLLANNLLHRR